MLALPRVDEAFLARFLRKACSRWPIAHGIELVGGDTTAGPLTVCITVFGEVPPGAALLRNGARAGDELWVSHSRDGGLGDARLALEVFRGTLAAGTATPSTACVVAMELPQPRVALGIALRGVAHAAIDFSDGLAGDLGHVLGARASARCSTVDALPRCASWPRSRWRCSSICLLAGGDDYELLFTAPAVSAHGACSARPRAPRWR